MTRTFRFPVILGIAVVALAKNVTVSEGGEFDDLNCSSPTIIKIVKKLAKQDFTQKVGGQTSFTTS